MTTRRTRIATAVAAGLLPLALASCGSSDDSPEVASIPTSSTSTEEGATEGAADDGAADDGATDGAADEGVDTASRPVLRVDDSTDRRTRIWDVYNTCLLDNGASPPSGVTAVKLGKVLVEYPPPEEAAVACLDLEPVQPPALAAATNPDFHDDSLAYVACLEERGLYVTLLNNEDLTSTYAEDHPVPDDVSAIEEDCMVEVFGE